VAVFALEVARLTGVVVVSPLPWVNTPRLVRSGLVMAMALLIHGHGLTSISGFDSLFQLVGWIALELAAGAAIGFVARLMIASAEIAGATLSPVMGFNASHMFDPATGESDTALSRMFRLLAILVALTAGVHRILIGSLLMSFKAFPVGTLSSPELSAPFFLSLSSGILETGVRLALPVLAVLLMVQLALAFVSRAAPAMQIFSIGFAVLLIVGGAVLFMVLPDLAREMLGEMSHLEEQLGTLLGEISVH
jgi:flagellar biosynthetic protein FliR